MRVYATKFDYERFAEEPFGGDDALLNKRLRAASIEVEKLTRRASYAVDEEGYPTDPVIAEAFAEATCAVVEYWQASDDPLGIDAVQGAVKIGSVSLGTTSSGSSDLSDWEKLQQRIGTRVIDILMNAGLIYSRVPHN